MKNVTITEISGSDVDFDQTIDSDTVTALAGGIAVNGSVKDSAFNTGRNSGIMSGDDTTLENSTVGNGNVQFNESTVGAFAQGGSATNIQGENLNLGSGDLIDVDTDGGDAQLVNGNGNQTFGDIALDAQGADGPINAVFGNGNRTSAVEDNSSTTKGSFNTDNSVEDSFNTKLEDSFNESYEDNDTSSTTVQDSFNESYEDNDTSVLDLQASYEDNSTYEDNDSFSAHAEVDVTDVDLWHAMDNDIDIQI